MILFFPHPFTEHKIHLKNSLVMLVPRLSSGEAAQALYRFACDDRDLPVNEVLFRMLGTIDHDGDLTVLNLSHNYLGPNGIMAILPVIEANTSTLRELVIPRQGATDTFIITLVDVLIVHPTPYLRYIDVSGNTHLTEESGRPY